MYKVTNLTKALILTVPALVNVKVYNKYINIIRFTKIPNNKY